MSTGVASVTNLNKWPQSTRQLTMDSSRKYLLSASNVPNIALNPEKLAVASSHGGDMIQAREQCAESAMLVSVTREGLSEAETFSEFQEQARQVAS